MSTVRVVVAYHSGYGHTALMAAHVAAGANAVPGVSADLAPVDTPTPDLWERLAAADGIIFGSPTYMGSPSAGFQTFAEASSRAAFSTLAWRDKVAAGFTTSSTPAGDKLNVLVDLVGFAAQHRMHWVGMGDDSDPELNRLGTWLGAAAHVADGPPEESFDERDLAGARHLGGRVAAAAVALRAGRRALAPQPA